MGAAGDARKPAAADRTPQQSDPVITRAEQPTERRSESASRARARRRASLTTRAIALAVVLLILTISYASSLRIYVKQRQDIAATRAQIAQSQQNIEQLSDEIARWSDPDYVRTQARDRLGWVLPGETGYRVVGPDGRPITGDAEINAEQAKPKPQPAWYDRMWGSVETADNPAPAKKKSDADGPVITEESEPTDEPKPSASPTG